jgi:hypothetical protein
MTKKPFGKGHRSSELLGLIHSDVCGPFNIKTYNHKEYFVTFIDDFLRYCYIYLISHKIEVFSYFKRYKIGVENHLKNIKILRIDRSEKFNSKEFKKYCEKYRIIRHTTILYTP